MDTETDFLVAVLRQAPQGSLWLLSTDSWEELPRVFGPDLLHTDNLNWHVCITSANRSRLLALAAALELPEKVVHMSLATAQGQTFFWSEDHSDTIICDMSFQDLRRLCGKFPHLGIIAAEDLLQPLSIV